VVPPPTPAGCSFQTAEPQEKKAKVDGATAAKVDPRDFQHLLMDAIKEVFPPLAGLHGGSAALSAILDGLKCGLDYLFRVKPTRIRNHVLCVEQR